MPMKEITPLDLPELLEYISCLEYRGVELLLKKKRRKDQLISRSLSAREASLT